MTSALFFTDVHGNRAAYDAALQLCSDRRIDLVILGGDLLPPTAEVRFVQDFLGPWARTLSRPVYAVPGNHDSQPAVDACEQAGILMTHRRPRLLPDGRRLLGYPYVPITPFRLKDWEKIDVEPPDPPPESFFLTAPDGTRRPGNFQRDILSKGTIRDDVARLDADPQQTVYLVHTPPARTSLDQVYGGAHVGSRAWREFIDRTQPPLTLHGHIHESPDLTGSIAHRLGATLSINPGDSSRRLRAALFELEHPAETLERI